jgi:hypothetical protein
MRFGSGTTTEAIFRYVMSGRELQKTYEQGENEKRYHNNAFLVFVPSVVHFFLDRRNCCR